MCMVSSVGDGWAEQLPNKWAQFNPPQIYPLPEVSKSEFDALRKEVLELKKLLVAAKKFDDATGQPSCEIEEKVKLIKAIAELVGVDLGLVFETKHKP